MDLHEIALKLQGLEETLIYKILDRAQFRQNLKVYKKGESGFSGQPQKSLLDLRLEYQEKLEAHFGRYLFPQERPFTSDLPQAQRKPEALENPFHLQDLNQVNQSEKLLMAYLQFIPEVCPPGDDLQYGSSIEHDVICLQAISSRIHYGAFYVAESKYQRNKKEYKERIEKKDKERLLALLTRKEVEESILERVEKKVAMIQQMTSPLNRHLVDNQILKNFFSKVIIPLTKEGEIEYLLHRPKEQ